MSTRTPTRTSRLVFIRGRLLSRVVRRQKTSRAQLRSDTRTLSRFPWNFTLLGHYLERVTRPSSPATLFSLRRFGYASAFLSRLASGADELLLSMVDEVGKKKKKKEAKRGSRAFEFSPCGYLFFFRWFAGIRFLNIHSTRYGGVAPSTLLIYPRCSFK